MITKLMFPSKRIFFIALVALYVCTLQIVYREIISAIYQYTGLGYREVDIQYLVISWVLALIPACWMPIELKRPSQLLYVVFYFTIYIPPLFIMYHCQIPIIEFNRILGLTLVMFIGLLIMGLSYAISLLQIHNQPISKGIFNTLIAGATFGFIIYLVAAKGNQLNFAFDYSQIYQVRSDYVESLTGNFPISYVVSLLSGLILPFFFSLGLIGKKNLLIALSVLGYIFLYGIAAYKASLLYPVIALVLYYIVTRHNRILSIIMVLVIIIALAFTFFARKINSLSVSYIALIPYRTFSVNSIIQLQYFDFFSSHQPTYLSHVKGFSSFITYPYPLYLSDLIPVYYYGVGRGANASPWSMDGLAGFGIWGIPIISIIISLTFFLLDSLAQNLRKEFTILFISYYSFSFTSTSFFTLLFSGGLSILMILIYLLPNDGPFMICRQDGTT